MHSDTRAKEKHKMFPASPHCIIHVFNFIYKHMFVL